MAPVAGATPPMRSARRALAVLLGLLAVAMAAAFWFLRAQPPSGTPARDLPAMSMVVLPLVVEGDAKTTEGSPTRCSAT